LSFNNNIDDFLREIVSHISFGNVGTASFEKLPSFGDTHSKVYSPHHYDNLEFLKKRGLTYTDFVTGLDNMMYAMRTAPKENIDIANIEIPKVDTDKEVFVKWYPLQPTPMQRRIEECNMWHKKIINAINREEKDLENWAYIDRNY